MSTCGCGWQDYDPWEAQKAMRKLQGPDVLKIKLLRRRGVSRIALSQRFGVTETIITYAVQGEYDDRIEEWKAGKSSTLERRFLICKMHYEQQQKLKMEERSWRKGKQQYRKVRQWLLNLRRSPSQRAA